MSAQDNKTPDGNEPEASSDKRFVVHSRPVGSTVVLPPDHEGRTVVLRPVSNQNPDVRPRPVDHTIVLPRAENGQTVILTPAGKGSAPTQVAQPAVRAPVSLIAQHSRAGSKRLSGVWAAVAGGVIIAASALAAGVWFSGGADTKTSVLDDALTEVTPEGVIYRFDKSRIVADYQNGERHYYSFFNRAVLQVKVDGDKETILDAQDFETLNDEQSIAAALRAGCAIANRVQVIKTDSLSDDFKAQVAVVREKAMEFTLGHCL